MINMPNYGEFIKILKVSFMNIINAFSAARFELEEPYKKVATDLLRRWTMPMSYFFNWFFYKNTMNLVSKHGIASFLFLLGRPYLFVIKES